MKELQKLSPKELANEETRNNLIASLQRGNRQAVTLANETGKKLFIEASPQYKTLNVYDGNGQRIKAEQKGIKQEQVDAQEQKAGKNAKQVNADEKQIKAKRPKQPL